MLVVRMNAQPGYCAIKFACARRLGYGEGWLAAVGTALGSIPLRTGSRVYYDVRSCMPQILVASLKKRQRRA